MQSLTTRAPGVRSIRLARVVAPVLVALSLLLAACGGGATSAPSASSAPSIAPSASGAEDPAAAVLAATIPTQVGDVALTVRSGTLPDVKDELPNYAELVLRLQNASVQPDDVLAAVGKPTAGGDDPTVGALEIQNAPPGGLGLLGLMQAWISSIPGATSENTNVGGKPVVKVTFDDGSLPLYYYLFDKNIADREQSDTLYFVRSADQALAQDALEQLP